MDVALSIEEHAAAIQRLVPAARTDARPLDTSRGMVLAQAVFAPVSLPGFDSTSMDGFAVRSVDLAGRATPLTMPVSGDIPAGRADTPRLAPGTAMRIMTGAPLPPGADLIVPVEATDAPRVGAAPENVRIDVLSPAGRFIRRAGDDLEKGALALPAGSVLGAAQLGLLAALGLRDVSVYAPLRVLVVSTGSELAMPGTALLDGQVYDANSTMLAAAIAGAGGLPQHAHFVGDDPDELLTMLGDAAPKADLALTSGGLSAGAYEVVKQALESAGVQFVRVPMQPGGPQGCGMFEGTPIVTFPGNPVSAFISFEVFLRPALRAAMGYSTTRRESRTLMLKETLLSHPDKRQLRRAHADLASGLVWPVGPPGSHYLGHLARSNALIVIPEEVAEVGAGELVEAWLLPE